MNLNPFKGADLDDIQEYLNNRYNQWKSDTGKYAASKWRAFREKGKERLTIMMIPHSEKKIFNFHISFFAISAWVLSLALIVVVASVVIIDHSSTVKEVDILIDNEKDSKKLIAEFRKETKRLNQLFKRFKPEIVGLYALTSGSQKKAADLFGGVGGPDDSVNSPKVKNDDMTELDEIPSEIDQITKIQTELSVAAKTVENVKSYLVSRKKIIENTPSVWPTEGYIASLFGKRINPYTGVVEQTKGIDIVSRPGAEVRSTAPGKVVFAGWDDVLGLTIRVKHKYGYVTTYGYNQRIIVKIGQHVGKNEIVAFVGRTGYATGFVSHYRVKIGTVYVDPMPYLNRIKIN